SPPPRPPLFPYTTLFRSSALTPRVSRPHQPDDVVPLADVSGVAVQMVFIGTCTGGRVVDFHEALDAFQRAGGRIGSGIQLVLTRSEEHTSELQSLTNLVC